MCYWILLTVVFTPLGYRRGLWSGGVVVIVGGGGGSLVGSGSRGRHVRRRPVPGRSHQTQLLGQLLVVFLVYVIKYAAPCHLNLKIPTMSNVLVFNFHFAWSIELTLFSFVPCCLWSVNISCWMIPHLETTQRALREIWGHSNPTLCKRICLNFFCSQVVGMQNLWAWVFMPSHTFEPPGETFTNYFYLLFLQVTNTSTNSNSFVVLR